MKKGGGEDEGDSDEEGAGRKELKKAAKEAELAAGEAARDAEDANEEGLSAKDLAKKRKEQERGEATGLEAPY